MPDSTPLETAVVAIPETAGSALYGMVDVLSVTGNVWQTLTRTDPTPPPFRVRVVSVGRERSHEDPSFFRRLFRRRTGVAPARYRRLFRPIRRGTLTRERRRLSTAAG